MSIYAAIYIAQVAIISGVFTRPSPENLRNTRSSTEGRVLCREELDTDNEREL